jgi:type II secretory pathway pseudopilin PulG
MTLMEMVVAMAIAAVLLALTSGVITTSTDNYKEAIVLSRMESEVRIALDRVASMLQEASRESLMPNNLGFTPLSSIEFETPLGLTPAGVVFGSPVRILTELRQGEFADGIDNDGNGVVDDSDLIMVKNFGMTTEQRWVLATGVPTLSEGESWTGTDDNGNGMIDESGFAIQVIGQTCRIALTVKARSPISERILTRSLATAIKLRNP